MGRDINRHYYTNEEIDSALKQPLVQKLVELIRLRNIHPAFNGEFHVKNEIDRGIKLGAGIGSLIGLFVGFMFGGPLGSLLLGGIGGAIVGKVADMGIDQKFVKEVKEQMEPGSSALFLLVREANTNAAIAALRPYQGSVYHTSLDPEAEEELRHVLKTRK